MSLDKCPEIIKAYVENRLAIFIGAGLSSNLGLPNWEDLSSKLFDKAKELKYIDSSIYNYYSDHNPKDKISIVKESFKDNDALAEFYEIFKRELTLKKDNKDKLFDELNPYYMLYNFFNRDNAGFHGLFLTTNADLCLDTIFKREGLKEGIVNKPEELSSDFEQDILYHFRYEKIIHLHGSIEDEDSLVFTREDYAKRYSDEKYRKLLDIIFKNFTVLFVGYSLSDPELDYFLSSSNKKHYLLKGYSSDYPPDIIGKIKKLDQEGIYNSNNIEIIPFELDETGDNKYINLFKKIENLKLNKEIIEKPFDDQETIIELINNSKEEWFKFTPRIINYIKNIFYNDKYSPFFVCQLGNDIPKNWYNILLDNDLLNVENDKLNTDIIIKLIFSISKNDYINNECSESFKKIMESLLNFKYKITCFNSLLIFKILLNIDNKHFTKIYAEESLEIFKNNRFIQSSELKEMLIKINQKQFNNVLKRYYDYIFGFEINDLFIKYNLDTDLLNKFLKEYINEISVLDKEQITKLLINKLELILEKPIGVITSIYNIDGDGFHGNQDCAHALVKCLITSLKEIENTHYIEQFYESEYSLLNRIAYYLIDRAYSSLKYIIWDNVKNPLTPRSAHEFSILLDHHSFELENSEINKLIGWINQCSEFYDGGLDLLNSIKKGWLIKLDQSNPMVIKELNKIDLSTNAHDYSTIEHYQGEFYAVLPNYLPELKNKTNKEIIEYISNEKLDEMELKVSFSNLLKLEPERFEDIFDFKELNKDFQRIILDNLNDKNVFKNIKSHDNILNYFYEINLDKSNYCGILKYLKKYISLNQINEEKLNKLILKYNNALKNCSNYDGRLNFNFSMDPLSLLYDVIFCYLTKNNSEKNPIKKLVINLLDNNSSNEFKYYLGKYTPIFYRTKEDFQDNNLIKILENNIDLHFLRGLIENYFVITDELYEYLNGNNLLEYDIINLIINSDVRIKYPKLVVLFVIFNYLNRNKEMLLCNFLDDVSNEELSIIIDIIDSKHVADVTYVKFISLWEKIIDLRPDVKILNELNNWIGNLDKIDERCYNLLKKSVPYIDETNCYIVMFYYRKLVENSYEYVGKLLLKQNIICSDTKDLKIILTKLKESEQLYNQVVKKIGKKYPDIIYDLVKEIENINTT